MGGGGGDSVCPICSKVILNSHSFLELKCNVHIAHGEHGTLKCPVCVTTVSSPATVNSVIDTSVVPLVYIEEEDEETLRRKANMMARATEPLDPIYQQEHGHIKAFFGGMLSKVSMIMSTDKHAHKSTDPFVLLKARAPLAEVVVDKHGIGITEMINDYGVTINTFFDNGYTLQDMCEAFGEERMNEREGIDVLCALGMHEDHFRRLPNQAQIGMAQQKLGYVPMDMVKRFGYTYKSPLTEGGWTLPELSSVGITFPVVMEAGLLFQSQWEELKQTATDLKQLALFGATPEKINLLGRGQAFGPPRFIDNLPPAQLEPTQSITADTNYQQQQSILYATPVVAASRLHHPHHQPPVPIVVPGLTRVEGTREMMSSQAYHQHPQPIQQQPQRVASINSPAYKGPRLVPRKKMVLVPVGYK